MTPPPESGRDPEPISRLAPALPGPGVISQFWGDLAFLHWRVDPARVEPFLPPGTRPDVVDGTSWVGLIPFELSSSAFGPLPAVPYFGRFAETNVRLYSVGADGRRGVVFRTLEASKLVPVLAARIGLGLPYTWAGMSIRRDADGITYDSRRRWPSASPFSPTRPQTHVRIRPLDEPVTDDPLAEFLTARWGMHVGRRGRTRFWPNNHPTWSLHRAELLELDDELLAATGFEGLAETPPDSVLYSPGVSTRFARPAS
ncbi:YqjF family protein [Frigoribacterium sp. 2-23]|uniref:YqjF family protein n=1 Tax=Frigoribacterium sp. 2-23 TaxID=3415006 RepID=UPI003C6F54EE